MALGEEVRKVQTLLTSLILLALIDISGSHSRHGPPLPDFMVKWDNFTRLYGFYPETSRLEMLEKAREMFTFGYDGYMQYAFPQDELDPIHCVGRGPDVNNPSNININDVLGDYSLSLVDALGTLAVMGNATEFKKAVKHVVDTVSFDRPSTVQIFEANIRVLGGLLSAHLLIEDEKRTFGNLEPEWYTGDLLTMAHDLADRLISAFEDTANGIPHPRVNLISGVPSDGRRTTCLAGAGSLVLEFATLSRLLGDPVYESYARNATYSIWKYRNATTGLFSNDIDIDTGKWSSNISGLGAGMDSFYEYLIKSYIVFEEPRDLAMFEDAYSSIKRYMRRGRLLCNSGHGFHPIYVNVNIKTGETHTNWIDSLQAAIPGVQVLHGDLQEAICHHAFYYAVWKRFGCLPERFNWALNAADVKFYPLRPEFVESTYLLFRATRNPFYLHVGQDVLESLNRHARAQCGYATIHDVNDMSLEDRQESFFLSETSKYLFLLFDFENPLHKKSQEGRFVFTTEGHLLPISDKIRTKIWETDFQTNGSYKSDTSGNYYTSDSSSSKPQCEATPSKFNLPIQSEYLAQVFSQIGVKF